MPDGLSVVGFSAFDQLWSLTPESIGNCATIAPDSVCIANTFGAVGVDDAASNQFEGVDGAVRAVRETYGQRDAIESGVDFPDQRHFVSALF